MFCRYCGREISEDAAFCYYCGNATNSFTVDNNPKIAGCHKGGKSIAVAGIILCILTLSLTIVNASIGAYKGYLGRLPFQHSISNTSKEKVENTPNIFSLRDEDGNVLMEGGIEAANMSAGTDIPGLESYVVEIRFTDSAAEKFAEITSEHIGEFIGIYLNDDILARPMVQCAITDGICQIANMPTYQSALDLADKLRMTIE